jgi:hypothetical protein
MRASWDEAQALQKGDLAPSVLLSASAPFYIARQGAPFGVSPDEAVAALVDVLDSIGATCPECRRLTPEPPHP